MSRPNWRDYYLGIARAVAARADCRRAQHGAILVRPDRTIASTGYNGSHRGGPSCLKGQCPRGLLNSEELPPLSSYDSGIGLCHALHAEQNCLATAKEDTTGYTLVITGAPCPGCIKTARAHRIALIVWPDGDLNLEDDRG